jgi:hypothetical protein
MEAEEQDMRRTENRGVSERRKNKRRGASSDRQETQQKRGRC